MNPLKAAEPLIEATEVQVSLFMMDFRDSARFFDSIRSELLEKYPGQWVAIFGGKLVDHDHSWDALVKRNEVNFPGKFVFNERVVPLSELSLVEV